MAHRYAPGAQLLLLPSRSSLGSESSLSNRGRGCARSLAPTYVRVHELVDDVDVVVLLERLRLHDVEDLDDLDDREKDTPCEIVRCRVTPARAESSGAIRSAAGCWVHTDVRMLEVTQQLDFAECALRLDEVGKG